MRKVCVYLIFVWLKVPYVECVLCCVFLLLLLLIDILYYKNVCASVLNQISFFASLDDPFCGFPISQMNDE